MYKKTADLHHLHERTASHATKGSGRGTVWWKTPDPENYDIAFHYREVRRKKAYLSKQYWLAAEEMKRLLQLTQDAVSIRDQAMIERLRPEIRAFSKNLKKRRKEIDAAISEMREISLRRKNIGH